MLPNVAGDSVVKEELMPNFTLGFQAMGSHIHVWLNTPTMTDAQILNDIPVWFEQWEQTFSSFHPDSELTLLNNCAEQWVRVSPAMLDTVSVAVRMFQETDGLFNPLVFPSLDATRYEVKYSTVSFRPSRTHRRRSTTTYDYHDILIDSEKQAIQIPAGAQIDLSGLTKGWAAQQVANRLSEIGACLVDVGGAIVARGAPDDSGGWLVSIHKPDRPGILYTLLLTDSAVATSGTDYRHWIRDSKRVNVRGVRSDNSDVLSATVVAPDAVQAEAWAHAAHISGKLPQFPTVLVRQGGSVVCNPEIESLRIFDVQ